MEIWRTIKKSIPAVNSAGYPFIGSALVIAIVAGLISSFLFWALLGLTIWLVIFFRDPERVPPDGEGLVLSPADGRIEPVTQAVPPAELEMGTVPMTRVSVFLSIFDCHVNRTPVSGKVNRIAYKPGKFVNADLNKSSEENERNSLLVDAGGQDVGVVQIAGLIARRIVCWTNEGVVLKAGDRIGMIRFGSRLDVYLPAGAEVVCKPGQRAIAGETVIARLGTAIARAPVEPGVGTTTPPAV
ncbi:phosphatidylserine decarboxylase [Afifella aestuarii]|uniref:phosphatidylserine decarboxylase n=1 Tax=Afifella aestuarii TaxID=1909496 RepID=UPI000FE2B3B3|nr:phosphatidylserine decarboxylase [Afifella aestuarii]